MDRWITEYVSTLEGLNRDNLASLLEITRDDFDFKDPFNHTCTRDDFIAILDDMYSKLDQVVFKVDQAMVDENQAMIYWRYSATSKFTGDINFAGTSLIKADQHGKVYFHHDYWDGSELLVKVPVIGKVVKFLRGKFSHQ